MLRSNLSSFICVAGNLGSGKTTFVRSLAKENGWQIRPTTSYDTSYLDDIFRDSKRWSFEAQVAFLTHKAQCIKDAVRNGIDFVVDRSIYEDIEIFAQIFADTGTMDPRAHRTYLSCARLILEEMPVPYMIIYCRCTPEECEKRLAGRPRPYQQLYPEGHIARLHEQYEEWVSRFTLCPLVVLDTHTWDTRNPTIMSRIIKDLSVFFSLSHAQKINSSERTINDGLIGNQMHLLQPLNSIHIEHPF